MSNTTIDNRIKAIYQADINSIRNLSKLANDLTQHGRLVVPGGLVIHGTTTFKGDTVFHKTMHVRNPKGWSYPNHPDGNIYLRGNVIMDGYRGTGKNLIVNGNINQKGKNVISTGDGIRIKKGSLYLNNTGRQFGSMPGNWSRWSYWSSSHDTGANLQIWKM